MKTDTIKRIAIILIAAAVIPVLLYFSRRKKEKVAYNMLNDTTLMSRYESEVRRDTVYRWADRIVYRKPNPDVVYVQKTDTVFTGSILKYNLPLRIEKSGDALDIKTVNIKDSVIREYVFSGIAPDFIITSTEKDLAVKYKNFYFEKPGMSLRAIYNPYSKKIHYEISSEAGVSYRNRIFLYSGCGYETNGKNFFFTLTLKLKGI